MMWKPNRIRISLLAVLGLILVASAEPPPSIGPDVADPEAPQFEAPQFDGPHEGPLPTQTPDDPGPQSAIRDALRGAPIDAEDPLLDGVLDAIRQKGSILDGSSLDRAPTPREPHPASGAPPAKLAANLAAKRARMAEQMLRVARKLEHELSDARDPSASKDDGELRFLVDRLRHHAGLFLIESSSARSNPDRLR